MKCNSFQCTFFSIALYFQLEFFLSHPSRATNQSIFFWLFFMLKKTFSILFLMFDSLGVFLLWVCSCLLQCHTQCCHRCLLRKKKEKKKPWEAVDPKQLSQSIARVNVTMSKWSAGENRAHRSRAVAQLQLTEGVIIHKKKKSILDEVHSHAIHPAVTWKTRSSAKFARHLGHYDLLFDAGH